MTRHAVAAFAWLSAHLHQLHRIAFSKLLAYQPRQTIFSCKRCITSFAVGTFASHSVQLHPWHCNPSAWGHLAPSVSRATCPSGAGATFGYVWLPWARSDMGGSVLQCSLATRDYPATCGSAGSVSDKGSPCRPGIWAYLWLPRV